MKIISLGAGVQSSALYFMSSIGIIPRADYAIFADTGAESESTYEYMDYLNKWAVANNGVPIKTAKYKNLEDDILAKQKYGHRVASIPAFTLSPEGKKGAILRQCTSEYKFQQIDFMLKMGCVNFYRRFNNLSLIIIVF